MSFSSPIYVSSPGLPPIEEYFAEIQSIWNTRILTNQGSKCQELQASLEDYLSVEHAPLFANGHLALQIALRALGLSSGEVITTPFTFASTTMAIVECGLTPVFCDINPDDFTLDEFKIEALITPQTKAIVPVHVYGFPCHTDAIEDIAKRHNLFVIYDAAHAFGETYFDKNIAQYGDISMFSLHATKVFNSVEGGVLCFNGRDDLYNKICAIRQFGEINHSADSELIGTNAKLTEFHSAMGICNLRHIDDFIDARRDAYSAYCEVFSDFPYIQVPKYPKGLKPNYAYFPIVISQNSPVKRDAVIELLEQNNVFARKYFYPLTSTFSAFHNLFPIQETPVAQSISERIICLPLHPQLSSDDATQIAKLILSFFAV